MYNHNNKDLFYPPGGILIWIIVLLEVSVFFSALVVMKHFSRCEPDLFQKSARHLNLYAGTLNTIVLLMSGYFMITALKWYRLHRTDKYKIYMSLTFICGFVFTLIKMIEYSDKISHGLVLNYNTFFTFYWFITGFHLIHVLIGMCILLYLFVSSKDAGTDDYTLNLEAGATFWHMCDLIWVIIFPTFYLAS